jgi:hypothetical protein
MTRAIYVVLALIGGCLFALPVQAQTPTDTVTAVPEASAGSGRRLVCFRGSSLDSCRMFFITELAFHMAEDTDSHGTDPYASWTNGIMVNLTDRDAVGAIRTHLELDNGQWDGDGLDAWFLRYRRWLVPDGPRLSLDVSIGRYGTLAGDPERGRYLAEVGVSLGDIVVLFGHSYGSSKGPQQNGGFKLGSWPGLILGQVARFYSQMAGGT